MSSLYTCAEPRTEKHSTIQRHVVDNELMGDTGVKVCIYKVLSTVVDATPLCIQEIQSARILCMPGSDKCSSFL